MKYEAFTHGDDLNKPNDGVLSDFRWPRNGVIEIQYYEPCNSCVKRVPISYRPTPQSNASILRSRQRMCERVLKAFINSL
jgi:hypothetical protein